MFDQDFDESESDDDLEQLAEGGGEEAQDGFKPGRHQVHFIYFSLSFQDHDPHEHGLDDHDTPRLIWQVDQLLPLTSDTDHQFYIFTCKTCKLVNCGLYKMTRCTTR